MAESKYALGQTPALRVGMMIDDPAMRAALSAQLEALGHHLVSVDRADVLIADRDPPARGLPTVVLGGAESECAGLLPANADPAQIAAALRAVAAGLTVRVASERAVQFAAIDESEPVALLTPREIEVLVGLSEGLSNKAVARRLDISQHTVKFHVESIFRKLGATSRAEAVAKGLRRGLVHL